MFNQALIDEGAGDQGLGFAFSELKFGVLEIQHALPERLALFDKVDGRFDRAFHFHHRGLSDVQALLRELLHQLNKATALSFTEQVGLWDTAVFKEHL